MRSKRREIRGSFLSIPFPESHFALLRQVNALVGVDILAELCGQLFLIISVDVTEDGIAIFLVTHHNAALPAPVIPIVARTEAGWQVLPKRWIVERSLAWINNSRRLSKDYEVSVRSAQAVCTIAAFSTLLKRF